MVWSCYISKIHKFSGQKVRETFWPENIKNPDRSGIMAIFGDQKWIK